MKCFALESFNLSCQAEHTKINRQLNFIPGLALIAFRTTHPNEEYAGRLHSTNDEELDEHTTSHHRITKWLHSVENN